MRFVSPLDEELILSISKQHKILVTIEENVISGGAGSAVNELLQRNNITIPTLTLGIPNYFVEQGEREALLAQYRLDRDGILNSILDYNSRISNN
jgi:1-deoxy-D-xylulose-5-phosphate synthase